MTDSGIASVLCHTIFTNILNIDENGTVTNTDAAHHRAAQWIRASCDPTYQIDPPLQPWETELT